jgi:cholest-4-en-3-one 26-monooxygenase
MTQIHASDTLAGAVDLSAPRFGESVPLETFARLRAEAPVFWYQDAQCWVVTTHALVGQVNRDFRRFSSASGITRPGDPTRPRKRVPVEMDPPEHTRYRSLVNRAFAPSAVRALGETVEQITAEVIGEFRAAGGGDFVADLAAAIPFRVMADIVGVPAADSVRVTAWGNTVTSNQDPDYRPSPEAVATARREYTEYCHGVVADRRAAPREDDLLTNLLRYEDAEGWRLSDDELADYVETLLTGGTETTRHLIAHMLILLLDNPRELERYLRGEVDGEGVVNESLRLSSPVMQHGRTAVEDVELAGRTIRRGDRVTLWMVSGNRDEAVFDDPDRFLADRDNRKVMSFGSGGPHFCLGAQLARLEGRVVLEHLRPVIRSVELAAPPVRVQSNFFNGIKRLPVRIR